MLTIFTIPKAFAGHIGAIQKNAIQSWVKLEPTCQVVLFGDEPGTKAVAEQMGTEFLPDIARNEYGTPLLNSAFEMVEKVARHPLLCYVNADIMLMSNFVMSVRRVSGLRCRFLMVGQRWDVDLKTLWDFSEDGWENRLQEYVSRFGTLHPPAGSDYFVYPRGVIASMPSFAVGRLGLDNWLIYHARKMDVPVIDATRVVTVIHQNHDYSHIRHRTGDASQGLEADRNIELAGASCSFTLLDASHLLTHTELLPAQNQVPVMRRLRRMAALIPIARSIARRIRNSGKMIKSAINNAGWRIVPK